MAFVCAVLPLDISQLTFAIIGAGLYALIHKYDQPKTKKQRISVVVETASQNVVARTPKQKTCSLRSLRSETENLLPHIKQPCVPGAKPDVRLPSIQPILAPTFQSDGWEGEVQELLLQITPGQEAEQTAKQLAQIIQRALQSLFPGIQIDGIAHGSLQSGKANGVAVPEIDIIANVSLQTLLQRFPASAQHDVKKLQKTAIRACTDLLVSAGGFKFRRSAFRGQEPKVTLLAPVSLGVFSESIPIDFSVNAVTPFYNTALLTECGQIDSRAKELVLIVRRWAKDRAICHAMKGHLSPYVWSILTIYFLQVGMKDEAAVLPPLDQFKMSSGLLKGKKTRTDSPTQAARRLRRQGKQAEASEGKTSAAMLFKDFVHVFNTEFDWHNEGISISAAQRAPPALHVPLHIIAPDANSATSQVGPTIEDPFHAEQNLGDGMHHLSLARLKEELSRADGLCLRNASLSELLEPWVPIELTEPHDNVELVHEAPAKKLPDAFVKAADWRRDAAEAQASMASPSAAPPWRRSGVSAGAKAPRLVAA